MILLSPGLSNYSVLLDSGRYLDLGLLMVHTLFIQGPMYLKITPPPRGRRAVFLTRIRLDPHLI
jgi:hypothetical protein